MIEVWLRFYKDKKNYFLLFYKTIIGFYLLLFLNNIYSFLAFYTCEGAFIDFNNFKNDFRCQSVFCPKISQITFINVNGNISSAFNENLKVLYATFVYDTRLTFFFIKIFFDIITSCWALSLLFYTIYFIYSLLLIYNVDKFSFFSISILYFIFFYQEIIIIIFDFYEFLCIDFNIRLFQHVDEATIYSYKNLCVSFAVIFIFEYLICDIPYQVKDEKLVSGTKNFALFLYLLLIVYIFMCGFILFL